MSLQTDYRWLAFDDIEVGSRVIVWAVPDEDNPLAERVVIIEPAA